jgi:quinol-cytochrome oxidoreductase complex cytochrome b subunit
LIAPVFHCNTEGGGKMKLFMQATVGSIALHVIYLVGMLLTSYIQTMNYTPDMEGSWQSVDTLQNEVAFGTAGSPFFYFFTFIGVAAVCGIVIVLYRRLRS